MSDRSDIAAPVDGAGRGPIQPGQRIAAIDALRGFALCGILLMNVLAMGGPIEGEHPRTPPDLAHPDWQVFFTAVLFVEGAMRALFSFLFGAGMLLFLRGAQSAGDAGRTRLFMRRAGWLILFGIVNSTLLLWPGDILMIYGIAAFAILPFARARPHSLLAVAGALLVVLMAWPALYALVEGAPTAAELARMNAELAAEGAARLGGYVDNLAFMSRTSWEWTAAPVFVWWILDGVAAMLIGMALLKLRILTGEASARAYARMALIGFAVGLPLGLVEAWGTFAHFMDPQPVARALYTPKRIALAVGWIGLVMWLWKSGAARWAFAPFAALGRMALTGYLGQSVLAALVFAGFGLGLWNALSWPQMWGVAAAIWIVEAGFCLLWLRWFRFGPMEWLWRWLTYGERPRLRA